MKTRAMKPKESAHSHCAAADEMSARVCVIPYGGRPLLLRAPWPKKRRISPGTRLQSLDNLHDSGRIRRCQFYPTMKNR